jgi:hypothetical protein
MTRRNDKNYRDQSKSSELFLLIVEWDRRSNLLHD